MASLARGKKKIVISETGTVMLINLSNEQSLSFYQNKNSPVSSQNISVINNHQKCERSQELKL